MITVLAGGTGAARFLEGLIHVVPPEEVTIISNTSDDEEFFGLHVSPDIDIVIYTLAGVVDRDKGWGFAGDSFHFLGTMSRFSDQTWFSLGDRDLATDVHRTHLLRQGQTLAEATAAIARAFGLGVTLLPMSNDPVRTVMATDAGEMPFQEYFVKRGFRDPVRHITFEGTEGARPAPGVLEALAGAEAIILAPSNPLVSIGPILAVPGIRDALGQGAAPVAAISPIVGGSALKGPADRMMAALGLDVSPLGVARLYQDFLDLLVMDKVDSNLKPQVEGLGLSVLVTNTIMADLEAKEALARHVLQAVRG